MDNSKCWTVERYAAVTEAAKKSDLTPRQVVRFIQTAKQTRHYLASQLMQMRKRWREYKETSK